MLENHLPHLLAQTDISSILLVFLLGFFVALMTIRALRTGRISIKGNSFSRTEQPVKFWALLLTWIGIFIGCLVDALIKYNQT